MARTSRKNENSLHAWSFYRLAQYIEYKAALLGITVEYVQNTRAKPVPVAEQKITLRIENINVPAAIEPAEIDSASYNDQTLFFKNIQKDNQ